MAVRNPSISVGVYCTEDESITVHECDVDCNPVIVSLGNFSAFQNVQVYLSEKNADKLMTKLSFILQDRMLRKEKAEKEMIDRYIAQ